MNIRTHLTFTTDQQGGKARINLPRGTKAITPEAAHAAMERIIATNAVLTTAGVPVGIHAAKVVATTRKRLV